MGGFTSRLNMDEGSFAIQSFYKKANAQLEEHGEVPLVGEIFEAVQRELAEKAQQPEFMFNHDTRAVTFTKRKGPPFNSKLKVEPEESENGADSKTPFHCKSAECKETFASAKELAAHQKRAHAKAEKDTDADVDADATVVVFDGDDCAHIDDGDAGDGIELVFGGDGDGDDDEEKYPNASSDEAAEVRGMPDIEMVATNSHIVEEKEVQSASANVKAWQKWSAEEVAAWIVSLDPTNYAQYAKEMVRVMIEEGDDGESLAFVDMNDLKGWGIKPIKHNKPILMSIRKLVAQ